MYNKQKDRKGEQRGHDKTESDCLTRHDWNKYGADGYTLYN
jgi:hypothetical protein